MVLSKEVAAALIAVAGVFLTALVTIVSLALKARDAREVEKYKLALLLLEAQLEKLYGPMVDALLECEMQDTWCPKRLRQVYETVSANVHLVASETIPLEIVSFRSTCAMILNDLEQAQKPDSRLRKGKGVQKAPKRRKGHRKQQNIQEDSGDTSENSEVLEEVEAKKNEQPLESKESIKAVPVFGEYVVRAICKTYMQLQCKRRELVFENLGVPMAGLAPAGTPKKPKSSALSYFPERFFVIQEELRKYWEEDEGEDVGPNPACHASTQATEAHVITLKG